MSDCFPVQLHMKGTLMDLAYGLEELSGFSRES
jgi:hypothetical protein